MALALVDHDMLDKVGPIHYQGRPEALQVQIPSQTGISFIRFHPLILSSAN
jgi:hypothetical protein